MASEQKRKFDPSSIKLPALVRFDAIFLPDSLHKARVIASTFAFHDAKNIRFLGDRQWDDGQNRRSIADKFLNGARVPVPVNGRYLDHLLFNLGYSQKTIPLDLERQVFDAFILARQAHYLAAGVNGALMISSLKEKTWKLEGTTHMSGMTLKGEPVTQYGLASYQNGVVSERLPSWVGAEWVDRISKSKSRSN